MKMTLFFIFMSLSFLANATGISNICDNESDKQKFKEEIVVKVNDYDLHSLTFELPKEFHEGYTLRSIVLNLYETEVLRRGDRSLERTRLLLRSQVRMVEGDNAYYARVSFRPKISRDVRLIASYKDDPPGVITFDGKECQFELREIAHEKLIKTTSGDET